MRLQADIERKRLEMRRQIAENPSRPLGKTDF